MAYKKRYDGRGFKETRPITAKAGVIKKADGSGYIKIGKTEAYAAVYGPRNLHPKFKQNPKKGVLRCFYSMMPFSGAGNRVRPGPSRRSKELMLVIEHALAPALNLDEYPNAVVDVFIDFPQTDAGTRCAGICAASIALADAGFEMKDVIASVSLGKVEDKMVIDLDYAEEAHEGGDVADIPVAMIPSTGEITLLQADGKFSPEELLKGLSELQPILEDIAQKQRDAVTERYKE